MTEKGLLVSRKWQVEGDAPQGSLKMLQQLIATGIFKHF